jgi:hypothetical protein
MTPPSIIQGSAPPRNPAGMENINLRSARRIISGKYRNTEDTENGIEARESEL